MKTQSADMYSQNGEESIIERILDTIGETNKWCVEFGAWDGIHFSNTRHLIEVRNYRAVLIEADPHRFSKLVRNTSEFPGVICLNMRVGFGKIDNLDRILLQTGCPKDFDLLSIDIDGNDYHVWNAIEAYRPKSVCIEFNPLIPNCVDYVQKADERVRQGASLSALVRLGQKKGYELVSTAGANALFVKGCYFPAFGTGRRNLDEMYPNAPAPVFVFPGYDGQLIATGEICLPWHGLSYGEDAIQPLPRMFRSYPPDFGILQTVMFFFYNRHMKLMKRLGRLLSARGHARSLLSGTLLMLLSRAAGTSPSRPEGNRRC